MSSTPSDRLAAAHTALADGRTGSGVSTLGIINVFQGRVYIENFPLEQVLRQFQGRYCEVVFVFPDNEPYAIDEAILPLIEALRAVGVETVSSCAGHWEAMQHYGGEWNRRPYVWYVAHTMPQHVRELFNPDWEEWYIDETRTVVMLRTREEADTLETLHTLHTRVDELAARIRTTLGG